MRAVRVINKRNGTELAKQARIADSFATRCRGLFGKQEFLPGEGLIIRPCRMVHMLFMRFPIDVVFCDVANRVVSIEENLKPWRFSSYHPQARFVLEVPAGICRSGGVAVGDEIELR